MVGHRLIGIKLGRDNKANIYTKDLIIALVSTNQLKKKLYRFNIGLFFFNTFHPFRLHPEIFNHNLLLCQISYCIWRPWIIHMAHSDSLNNSGVN